MAKNVKPPKPDAGTAAQAHYEQQPSSSVGEFSRAKAQLADLHQTGSTEKRRTGEGPPAK